MNRRNSDLCDKSDGVLYTSDGRDVEMSVASTKAFYAQIAAGLVLATAIADLVPGAVHSSSSGQQQLLAALRELPDRMAETLARRDQIAAAAHQFGPPRRAAIVGNGPNQIAAGSGSSCPSSATSRSPATRPRTRSTSTSPPNR